MRVGPATVGDVICFEVAYDDIVRDTVTGGGQLLVVQTNNATFNDAEARQQLAMVRLRAVEHGRHGADGLDRRRLRRSSTPTGRCHDATAVQRAAPSITREVNLRHGPVPWLPSSGAAPELVLAWSRRACRGRVTRRCDPADRDDERAKAPTRR